MVDLVRRERVPLRWIDISVAASSRNLLSREDGRIISSFIEKEIAGPRDNGCLILDFRSVRFATLISLGEIVSTVSRFQRRSRAENHILFALDAGNPDLRECVVHSLREAKCLVLSIDDSGACEILGEPTASQKDTFSMVYRHGRMTSVRMCSLTDISVNAASTRLHALHTLRLIARTEKLLGTTGGREFVYHPVIDPAFVRKGIFRGKKIKKI